MFSDNETEVTGFESTWKTEISLKDGAVQTSQITNVDQNTNTAKKRTVQVQTETVNNSQPKFNVKNLSEWLNKIYPLVDKELNSASESRAFQGYLIDTSKNVDSTKVLQTLQISEVKEDNPVKYSIGAITWNATGNTLSASCRLKHDSWCNHISPITDIKSFTINRNGKYPDIPDKTRNSSACITTLKAHPSLPGVLAGGNIIGEILIWYSQGSIFKSNHTDSVTDLVWTEKYNNDDSILISSSLDGMIFVWQFSVQVNTLTLKKGLKISTAEHHYSIDSGITCMSFSAFISDLFVIGTEGGKVVRCSLDSTKTLSEVPTEMTYFDPIVYKYENHDSIVISVQFSPHRKDLFLSYSLDKRIHFYNIDQEMPVQMIFTDQEVINVYWVPGQPKLLIGCSNTGGIILYSLLNGKTILDVNLQKLVSILIIAFNPKNANKIATGDIEGNIQLWNIEWSHYLNEILK